MRILYSASICILMLLALFSFGWLSPSFSVNGPNLETHLISPDGLAFELTSATLMPSLIGADAGQLDSNQLMRKPFAGREKAYYRCSKVKVIIVEDSGCEMLEAYRYISAEGAQELLLIGDSEEDTMSKKMMLTGTAGDTVPCKGGAVDQPLITGIDEVVRSMVCLPKQSAECVERECPHLRKHVGKGEVEECRDAWGDYLCP